MAYLDTSALAKRYLNEPSSEEFEAYLSNLDEAVVSSVTVVEMRCLLARHRRMGHLDPELEHRVFAAFEEDVDAGYLLLQPVQDRHVLAATHLISRLAEHQLRTLDAIHLSLCQGLGVEELATADVTMAGAGAALGLRVVRFDRD